MRHPLADRTLAMPLVVVLFMLGCRGGSGTSESASTQPAVSRENPCSLLTPEEVVEAVGMTPFVREVVDEVTCGYEFPEAANKPEAAAEAGGPKSEQEQVEAMAKEFTVGASGGVPKFSYAITWEDGETAVMATRMANQMLGSEGESGFTKLEGIGDEAWLGPLASTLVVRKGDVAVEFDLRLLPQGRERGIRLAQAAVRRLP